MVHNIDDQDLKNSIARLSHFLPSAKDEYGHQLLDYIVLDSISEFGLVVVSSKEIKTSIKKNLLIDFEEDEIISAGKRLVVKKFLKLIDNEGRFDKPKFILNERTENQVFNNKNDLLKLENEVFENWRNEILSKYNGIEELSTNIGVLTKTLQNFIAKMFVKHGVETVSLLYPGDNKAKQWLKENGNRLFDEILGNAESFLNKILRLEIPLFFHSEDKSRIQYLSNLFNSSFFWHLIQVDDKCSQLLKKVTRGQKLIIDNNILYSLVGLHGSDALDSSHTMLKFANELGYDLVVTTKTIDEFQNTLKWQLKESRTKHPVSANLAALALEELGVDNFITMYWAELVKNGVSIEEFVSEISHIDSLLEGLKIIVSNKFREDIENSEELLDEMSILRQACGESINEHIVEHDAFHRILIQKLRKGHKYKFNEAKAWFLTHDHKLPQYSKFARKGQAYLPFCITTNEWIQINRPLLTRTKNLDEFERSFQLLVTQSYVRSMLPTIPMEQTYNRVLGKLEQYREMSPEFAAKIVSDTHFMMSMTDIDDDDEITKKIEGKFLNMNKELRRANESLILEKKEEERKVAKLEKKIELIEDKLKGDEDFSQRERDQLSAEMNDLVLEKEKIREALEVANSSIINKTEEVRELQEIIAKNKIDAAFKKFRNVGYRSLVLFVIIGGLIAMVFFFKDEPWNFVSYFVNLAEQQSEFRKEIVKWSILLVCTFGQSYCLSNVWNHLLKPTRMASFKKNIDQYI